MTKTTRLVGPLLAGLLFAAPAFATPDLALDVQVFDDVDSCDEDGVLDVGEVGRVVVVVRNQTDRRFGDAVVRIKPADGLVAAWTEVDVPRVEAFGVAVVEFEVSLEKLEGSQVNLRVRVDVPDTEGVASSWAQRDFMMNVDAAEGVSRFDDVEYEASAWRPRFDDRYGAGSSWARGVDENQDHVWFVVGSQAGAHASLESPVLYPAHGEDFVVSFSHRYQMSGPDQPGIAGGVIEMTLDGGLTWQDASAYAEVPYDGTVGQHDSDLEGRLAFVGSNPNLPSRSRVALNFGETFQGEHLQLRFRYAAAPGERGAGWELDDFEVQGTYNTPFNAIVEHRGKCVDRPELEGRPKVRIYLPDDPQGDAQGFMLVDPTQVVDAVPTPAELAQPERGSLSEAETRVLVEQIRPYQSIERTSGFGRIDGGQVVAAGCTTSAPGSVPFAMGFVFVGWLFMARRRR